MRLRDEGGIVSFLPRFFLHAGNGRLFSANNKVANFYIVLTELLHEELDLFDERFLRVAH